MRLCCCDYVPVDPGQEYCACATESDGLNASGCACDNVSCSGGGLGASCCAVTFTLAASLDGMLYRDTYGGVWDEGDSVSIVDATYAEAIAGGCVACSGSCAVGDTVDDEVSYNCLDIGAGTAKKFKGTPTLCSGLTGVAWPANLVYAPVACSVSSCYCGVVMGYTKPLRFYSSYSATFRWKQTAGFITPTACVTSGNHSANVERLSATSDSGMVLSDFSYRCIYDATLGVSVFEIRIAWQPNWERERVTTCSGCDPVTVSDVVAGTPSFGLTVLYRLPVSASVGQHPCGIGLGSYAPHSIISSGWHPKSLGAFSDVVVS